MKLYKYIYLEPNLFKTIEKNAYENAELVGRTIANSIVYL